MPFVCECGSDDFYTHGEEKVVWYVNGDGDIMETGDYLDSKQVATMPYICSNCEREYSTIPPQGPEEEWVDLKQKYYLSGHTNTCPICNSDSIEGGNIEVSGNQAYQSVWCGDCGSEWTDIYTMSGVSIDSYPTDSLPQNIQEEITEPEPPEVPDPNEAFTGSKSKHHPIFGDLEF